MILIALYIFFAIFWSFFPYAFKCVLVYKITSISYCIHGLFYAIFGLICWLIALGMYNSEQLEQAKSVTTSKARTLSEKAKEKSAKMKAKAENYSG